MAEDAARRPDAALGNGLFLILASVFIASLVTCNLIFNKFFHWNFFGLYDFELSVGILPYPITFLVTDIISELYGKKRADRVVVAGLAASIFILLIILTADAVSATSWSRVDNATFHLVFGLAPVAVFASMVAYLSAQFLDIRIFHYWKKRTAGRHLWLRNNASTMCSQLVDTTVVLTLLLVFSDAIHGENFSSAWTSSMLFKIGFAALDTPVFYLSVWLLAPLSRR